MLTYRVGSASSPGAGQEMAHYVMESEAIPELQGALSRYYTQAGHSVGALAIPDATMHPVVAKRLGIDSSRPLTVDELSHLLAGKRADGAVIEDSRQRRNSYIDFVLSAPKSFSVALVFAPTGAERDKLDAAHRDAVNATMAHVSKHIGRASVGDTAHTKSNPKRENGHIAVIQVDHWTARPVRKQADGADTKLIHETFGDPDRHTHCLIPNICVTDTGRATRLDSDAMSRRIHEWGSIYQAFLATNLRKHGISVELDSRAGLNMNERMARLTDVPQWVCDEFSKLSNEGKARARAYAAERGMNFDDLSAKHKSAMLKSGIASVREAKPDKAGQYESWMRQARTLGYKHRSVLRPRSEEFLRSAAERHRQAYEVALPLMAEQFAKRAVLEGEVPRVAAAKGLIASGIADASEVNVITAAMRSEGVVQDGERTALHWSREIGGRFARVTTQLSVSQENEAIALFKQAAADKSVSLTPEQIERAVAFVSRRDGLDFTTAHGLKQREFIDRLGQSGRAAAAVGVAGSGKSAALRPLIHAWHEMGRETWGVTLAWRQTAGLKDAGVGRRRFEANKDTLMAAGVEAEHTFALNPFLKRVTEGKIALNANSTVIIDEVALVGTRDILTLARLQAKHGFHLVGIGDDMQCQVLDAGASLDLMRRAFGADAVPELLSSVRQIDAFDRDTVALWRDGNALEALRRKDAAGDLHIVPGGESEAIRETVKQWAVWKAEDPNAVIGVDAPTNAETRAIGNAIRLHRRALGEIGRDLFQLRACDQSGDEYLLPIAPGDRVRLFDRVYGQDSTSRSAIAGVNGTVVEVIDADRTKMTVRKPSGLVTSIKWADLRTTGGRVRLSYGDAVTIDARQSETVTKHITSMPNGTSGVNGFKMYTSGSRHRAQHKIIVSQGAEKMEIQQRRPLGDPRNEETDIAKIRASVIDNMARNLSQQPKKTLAVDFIDRAANLITGAVGSMTASWQRPPEQTRRPPPAVATVLEARHEERSEIAAIQTNRALLDMEERTSVLLTAARGIAYGDMEYSEAMAEVMLHYLRSGGPLDKRMDDYEKSVGACLADLAARIQEKSPMAPVPLRETEKTRQRDTEHER